MLDSLLQNFITENVSHNLHPSSACTSTVLVFYMNIIYIFLFDQNSSVLAFRSHSRNKIKHDMTTSFCVVHFFQLVIYPLAGLISPPMIVFWNSNVWQLLFANYEQLLCMLTTNSSASQLFVGSRPGQISLT